MKIEDKRKGQSRDLGDCEGGDVVEIGRDQYLVARGSERNDGARLLISLYDGAHYGWKNSTRVTRLDATLVINGVKQ